MIRSSVFHSHFGTGFSRLPAPVRARRTGKASTWEIGTAAGPLTFEFRVNPKASAIPGAPGQFWPVIHAPESLRYPEGDDDGTVSWYQYSTEADDAAFAALQRRVFGKFAAQDRFEHELHRQLRDQRLELERTEAGAAFEARFPDAPLKYMDADDAAAWGTLFAERLPAWLERFELRPETLTAHMWRVHWAHLQES